MAKPLPVIGETPPEEPLVDPNLPVFQEARLDRDDLDCLLADLDDLTEILEIRVKGADPTTLSEAGPNLLDARRLLLEGRAGALQIVYRFADRTWCDTLIAEGTETRLLRLEEPSRVR